MGSNSIFALRKAKGMTQAALAEAIGTTLNNLGKLERGTRRLNMDWIEKIADALKVEPYQVLKPVDEADDQPAPLIFNEKLLARLLVELGPSVPKGEISESAAEALAEGLARGFELLAKTGAIDPTERELSMAAHVAISRFRESLRS